MTEKSKEKNIVEYKAVIIGNPDSGKTLFFKKARMGFLNDKNISTIGIDKCTLYFTNQEIKINDTIRKEDFNIILYDTAGQERFRALTKNYFNSTDIFIILYNINSRSSFESVELWIKNIKENLSDIKTEKYLLALIGNNVVNIDEEEQKREVEEEEAKSFCEKYGIYWAGECSLKDSSEKEVNELIINIWKKYVEKFGIKSAKIKLEPILIKKYKKKNNCQ